MTLGYVRNQVEPGGFARKAGVTRYPGDDVLVDGRVDNSRANSINGYPERSEFLREALREPDDREFRTAVMGYIRETLLAADRRHIDHPTIGSRHHTRKNRTGGEEMSFKVDIENTVPFRFGQFKKRRIAADAGIVDQNINWPEVCFRLGDERGGRGRTGHIMLDSNRFVALLDDRRFHRFRRGRVYVRNNNGRASAGQLS